MLLTEIDPTPVDIVNPRGASPFLLIGDHAGDRIPEALDGLGLDPADLSRHIGWDIGIADLGDGLATRLDAVSIRQRYSRLVVDCNRDPAAIDAVAEISDGTPVPGNVALSIGDRTARFAEIHEPYHKAIADELVRRDAAGIETVLVALHSFTPVMGGVARPWQAGILHDGGDTRFAMAFMAALRRDQTLTVGDNEPYRMDSIDYTIPRHAYPKRPYVEIEVRQDLISTPAGITEWVERIARSLEVASAD